MSTALIKQEMHTIQTSMNQAMERMNALEAMIDGDYLTTRQFAVLVNRDPKTISNKAGAGDFEASKFENGVWLIHKSELEKYNR